MNHLLIRWKIRMLELDNKAPHKFNVTVEEEAVPLTLSFLQIRKKHKGTIIIDFVRFKILSNVQLRAFVLNLINALLAFRYIWT